MGTGTQRVTAKGAVLWQILVPVALAFVLFAGGLYVMGESTTVTAAADNAYDVLKDTLTIVLAVGALVIAVLGLGGYTFLRITLRRDVAEHVNQRFSTAMAWQSLNLGYTLWDQYSHTRELFLLRHAIELTADAHKYSDELDSRQRSNQELGCVIRNNWAYYLAEKVKASSEKDLDEKDKATDEEKAVALSLADYVEHKIVVVPNRAEDFSETVTFVRTHVRQGTNTKQAHA